MISRCEKKGLAGGEPGETIPVENSVAGFPPDEERFKNLKRAFKVKQRGGVSVEVRHTRQLAHVERLLARCIRDLGEIGKRMDKASAAGDGAKFQADKIKASVKLGIQAELEWLRDYMKDNRP